VAEEYFSAGLAAFDTLQPGQKLALLAQVGRALHDKKIQAPELTAHTEAAVAAVYEYVRQSAYIEIDLQGEPDRAEYAFFWRRLILRASEEMDSQPDERLPDEHCDDVSEWELLIDCLTDRIFWDADYEMGDTFLDAAPDVSRDKMYSMRIADDYFVALPPDPNEAELQDIRQTLRKLTGKT
jgi:hypothetical protein